MFSEKNKKCTYQFSLFIVTDVKKYLDYIEIIQNTPSFIHSTYLPKKSPYLPFYLYHLFTLLDYTEIIQKLPFDFIHRIYPYKNYPGLPHHLFTPITYLPFVPIRIS